MELSEFEATALIRMYGTCIAQFGQGGPSTLDDVKEWNTRIGELRALLEHKNRPGVLRSLHGREPIYPNGLP